MSDRLFFYALHMSKVEDYCRVKTATLQVLWYWLMRMYFVYFFVHVTQLGVDY